MRDWKNFFTKEDFADWPFSENRCEVLALHCNELLAEELEKSPVAYEFIGTYRLWRKRSYARKKDLRSARLIDIQNLKPPKEP